MLGQYPYQHIKILKEVPLKLFLYKDKYTGLDLNAMRNILILVHTGYSHVIHKAGT